MSWFKRRPKIKEPPHHTPKHTSPAAEKQLKERKDIAKPKDNKKSD